MRNTLIIATIAFSLSACQTVQDQSIPLPSSLQQSSQLIEMQRPTWRITDTAFHQNLGSFQIDSADISWGRSHSTQQWAKETGGWLNGIDIQDKFLNLVLLDLLRLRKSTQSLWNVRGERDFAFSLHQGSQKTNTVDVRCRAIALSEQLQTVLYSGSPKANEIARNNQDTHQRQYLSCELKQGATSWYLNTETIGNKDPVLSLSQKTDFSTSENSIDIELVRDAIYLLNGQWQSNPVRFRKISGLTFGKQQATFAALSLDGSKAKFWVKNELPESQRALLLAASYSLLMYDWIDGSWRSLFQH